MLSSEGDEKPKRHLLVTWGVLTGVVAVVLLLANGLNALQQTVIVTSAPFILIIAGVAVSLWKDLRHEARGLDPPVKDNRQTIKTSN
jgi:glycine betaine transporter